MAEETDGIEEAFESQLRVLVTAAGQIGERIARAREDALRRAQATSEQETRELASRQAAEQRAVRTELGNVYRADWWDRATPEQIGHTYQVTRAWSQEDHEAVRAEARMRDELRTRYGVDVDHANVDPAAVRAAVERADSARAAQAAAAAPADELDQAKAWFAQHEPERLASWQRYGSADTLSGMRSDERNLVEAWRSELGRADRDRAQVAAERTRKAAEDTEAHRLAGMADRENSRAEETREAAEHEIDPEERARAAAEAEQREATADRAREDGRTLYDSAERRAATAGELEAKGMDREVVATRMRADVSHARPATDAAKSAAGATSPQARKKPGRAAREQRTGIDR